MQFVNFCSLFGKFGSFYLSLSSRGLHFMGDFRLVQPGPPHYPDLGDPNAPALFRPDFALIAQLTGQEPCQVWKDRSSAVKLLAYAIIALNWTPRVKARVNK